MASTGAVRHRLRAGLGNAVKTPQKNRRKQQRLPTGLRRSGVRNADFPVPRARLRPLSLDFAGSSSKGLGSRSARSAVDA